MKLDLFHICDWLDGRILRHRFLFVCQWIANWGDFGPECRCSYCVRCRS